MLSGYSGCSIVGLKLGRQALPQGNRYRNSPVGHSGCSWLKERPKCSSGSYPLKAQLPSRSAPFNSINPLLPWLQEAEKQLKGVPLPASLSAHIYALQ